MGLGAGCRGERPGCGRSAGEGGWGGVDKDSGRTIMIGVEGPVALETGAYALQLGEPRRIAGWPANLCPSKAAALPAAFFVTPVFDRAR